MVVQVYAIAHIAINLGFHIFTPLNSFFPHFFLFLQLECECAFVMMLDYFTRLGFIQ